MEIGQKVLGRDHPEMATTLNNRAEVLIVQVRSAGCFLTLVVGTEYALC